MKNEHFIIQVLGLVLLSGMAVFFAILEVKYNKELIDLGLMVGIISSIIGAKIYHATQKGGTNGE